MNLLERASGVAHFDTLFSDAAFLSAMAQFEGALAGAQADADLIDPSVAQVIAQAATDFTVEAAALAERGAHAGSLGIAYVSALRAHLGARDTTAASLLHQGSTSQDLLDTAMVLCTREALATLEQGSSAAAEACHALALAHGHTPVLARTLLQPAGITSFGFKAAQWRLAIVKCQQRIAHTAQDALAVALGGATGNLAAYGEHGAAVRAALARRLGVRDPGGTWHTLRHPWIALACDTALLCGTLGKIAQDLALMAQFEVGEVEEPAAEGRGGSSAMPHKQNPVLSLRVLTLVQPVPGWTANLLAAMPQAHERALGGWQAELAQIPELFRHACAAAHALGELLAGLVVQPQRCLRNIEALGGVIFAEPVATLLAAPMGKAAAQALLADLSRRALATGVPLRDLVHGALAADARLASVDPAAVDACFDIAPAARAAGAQVAALLAAPRS